MVRIAKPFTVFIFEYKPVTFSSNRGDGLLRGNGLSFSKETMKYNLDKFKALQGYEVAHQASPERSHGVLFPSEYLDTILSNRAAVVRLRSFLRNSLVRVRAGEQVEGLGYGFDELIRHIESQCADWMNWDNYGTEWEIDHILPVQWFIETSQTVQGINVQLCNSLPNLRPLPIRENRSKGRRFDYMGYSEWGFYQALEEGSVISGQLELDF